MKVIHLINGIEINEPNNYDELEIETRYTNNGSVESVTVNNWEFGVGDGRNGNDAAIMLRTIIANGLVGGVGVGEGVPFSLVLDDEISTTYNIFDGYIDLWASRVACDSIIAPAVEQGKIDWLNDVADSVTFEYLYENSAFTSTYFVPVPYCINKKQSSLDTIVTILSVFVIANELRRCIKDVNGEGLRAANPFETVGSVLNLILSIAYIIVLIAALVQLLFDLFSQIVQPVKYHNGMYVKDLMAIGCAHFGLTFQSSILQGDPYKNMLLLPEKYNVKENNTGLFNKVVGYLVGTRNEKMGYYRGTFGELLRSIRDVFNAKIEIENGILYFEPQSFNLRSAQYQLPDVEILSYRFNKDDFNSNYIVSFTNDFDDRNTIQEYAGNSYQVIQSAIAVANTKMVLLKNIKEVRLPYSRGIRKTSLTFAEEILNLLFQVVGTLIDTVIQVINAIIAGINAIIRALNRVIRLLRRIGINLGNGIPTIPNIQTNSITNLIEGRINMLVMESDYVSVPKLLLIDSNNNTNLNFRNNTLMLSHEGSINAKRLFDNYHYFSNFVETNGVHNQHKIYEFENIPFTFSDYEKTRFNSNVITFDGRPAKLESIKWKPLKQTASGVYRVNEKYTNNLVLTTIYPNE